MDEEARKAERVHDKNYDFAVKLNEAVINNANIALRTVLVIKVALQ